MDNLMMYDHHSKQVTIGLANEDDAAVLIRKLDGFYMDGHQLQVAPKTKAVSVTSKNKLPIYQLESQMTSILIRILYWTSITPDTIIIECGSICSSNTMCRIVAHAIFYPNLSSLGAMSPTLDCQLCYHSLKLKTSIFLCKHGSKV